jgi:hypothetical protein
MENNDRVRGLLNRLEGPRDPSWFFDKCQTSKGRELKLKKACSF